MNAFVRSVIIGSVLEVAAFVWLIPKDSTQPPSRLQEALAYTQAPGGGAFFLPFGTGLGHQLDRLPLPLGIVLAGLGFAVVFLLQSAVMGVPVWLVFKAWSALRRNREAPDARLGV